MAKTKKRYRSQSQSKQPVSAWMIGIVAVVSILLVGGLIYLGTQTPGRSKPVDVSQFPFKGAADAPVTFIEFSDYG